jgi:hypothetical protein
MSDADGRNRGRFGEESGIIVFGKLGGGGRGRSQSRGCCIIVPVGCLMSVLVILVFSGLALAQLL